MFCAYVSCVNSERSTLFTALVLVIAPAAIMFLTGHTPDPVNSDLAAYHQAFSLFFAGLNPYSPAEIMQRQCIPAPPCHPIMVWNPPIVFVTIAPFIALLPFTCLAAWSAVSSACGVGLVWLGYRFASRRGTLPPELLVAATCSSLGLLKELEMGQWSAVIAMLTVTGFALYRRNRDFMSGLVLGVAIVKPHIFFVPGVLLAVWIVRERRWRVPMGALTAVTAFGLLAELVHPGIFRLWLSRETWPDDLLGATLSSLMRGYLAAWGRPDRPWLAVVISLAGVALLGVARSWHKREPSTGEMMIAIAFNPLLAPYGHVFEQLTLLTPFAYIAGLADTGRLRRTWYLWLLTLQVIVGMGLPAALHNPPLGALPLAWFSQPIAWIIFGASLLILSPMRFCNSRPGDARHGD